ncbi:MAG: AI-2E family transporter, partial [Spirochaetaceae bacterium]|nr:AI-2E family transporter [Spirochaetaceae bacterium]
MEQQRTKKQIFLIFYIALFILVARMFYPYLTPLLWSCLIYSMTKSLFERCVAHIKPGRKPRGNHSFGRSLLAGIFAILGIVLIVFPIGYLIVALLRQLLDVIGSIIREVEANPDTFSLKPDSPIGGFIYRLSQGTIDLGRIDLVKEIRAFLTSSSESIISYSGTAIKNFANMVINFAFMLFSLFFLYLDGKQLMELVVSAIPLKKSVTTMFMTKIRESSHQLISGYFLVALYQGTAMFLISLAFG